MIWLAYICATCADIVTSVIARRNPRIALAVVIAVIVLTAPVPLWTLTVATVLFGCVAAWNVVQIARAG